MAFRRAAKKNDSVERFDAPMMQVLEGSKAKIWSGTSVRVNGISVKSTQSMEALCYVNDDHLYIRAVAEITQPVTNIVAGVEQVTTKPVVQSALEARVVNSGAIVIWQPQTDTFGYLILMTPKVVPEGGAGIPANSIQVIPATKVLVTPK